MYIKIYINDLGLMRVFYMSKICLFCIILLLSVVFLINLFIFFNDYLLDLDYLVLFKVYN